MTTPSTSVRIGYGHPIAPDRPQSALRHLFDQFGISVVATLALALLVSGIYPVVVWGISQALFRDKANGSLVIDHDGKVRGSYLLGQTFSDAKYFHPRPSAAGAGYAADGSSGTNLGPTSDKLINGIHGSKKPDGTPDPASDFDGIKDLAAAYRKENALPNDMPLPADAVTRSASGLDPHISVANARLQASRVAKASGMAVEEVNRMIDQHTEGRGLGFLGEPGVNVVRLNLALDRKPADSR